MNILICTFSFPSLSTNTYDGKFVESEALAYAENGAKVRVITPHFRGASKIESIHDNITVYRFQYFIPESMQRLKIPGKPIYNATSLLSILQIPILCIFFSLNIFKHSLWSDLIHAQWTVPALLALPAKFLLKKRIIMTVRGSDIRLVPKFINKVIHHFVDAAVDCHGPVQWRFDYRKEFNANFLTLPLIVHIDSSGVIPEEIKTIKKRKPDAFIILYVGRFDYLKVHQNKLPLLYLIHAASILRSKGYNNFHIAYVGSGEQGLIDQLMELIEHYSLDEYVSLLGPKTDVLNYMHFCDMGVGGIALNAVSQEFTILEKPQLLIDGYGNIQSVWKDKTNAIFVKPDDEKDLADKMIWAISHKKDGISIGKRAKADLTEYIMDTQAGGKLYLEKFKKICDSA